MGRILHGLLFVPFATIAIYACSSDDSSGTTAEGPPSGWTDVRYGETYGGTTDEALTALATALAQPPKIDDTQAPFLSAPAAGALAAATPPTFTFTIGKVALRKEQAPARFTQSDDGVELEPHSLRFVKPTLSAFGELIGPIRTAWAHGVPFSGTAVLMTFSSASNPKLLRVFTADASLTYTPTADDWSTLVAARAFDLDLVSAVFSDNRLLPDGGPFQGSKTSFTVAP